MKTQITLELAKRNFGRYTAKDGMYLNNKKLTVKEKLQAMLKDRLYPDYQPTEILTNEEIDLVIGNIKENKMSTKILDELIKQLPLTENVIKYLTETNSKGKPKKERINILKNRLLNTTICHLSNYEMWLNHNTNIIKEIEKIGLCNNSSTLLYNNILNLSCETNEEEIQKKQMICELHRLHIATKELQLKYDNLDISKMFMLPTDVVLGIDAVYRGVLEQLNATTRTHTMKEEMYFYASAKMMEFEKNGKTKTIIENIKSVNPLELVKDINIINQIDLDYILNDMYCIYTLDFETLVDLVLKDILISQEILDVDTLMERLTMLVKIFKNSKKSKYFYKSIETFNNIKKLFEIPTMLKSNGYIKESTVIISFVNMVIKYYYPKTVDYSIDFNSCKELINIVVGKNDYMEEAKEKMLFYYLEISNYNQLNTEEVVELVKEMSKQLLNTNISEKIKYHFLKSITVAIKSKVRELNKTEMDAVIRALEQSVTTNIKVSATTIIDNIEYILNCLIQNQNNILINDEENFFGKSFLLEVTKRFKQIVNVIESNSNNMFNKTIEDLNKTIENM